MKPRPPIPFQSSGLARTAAILGLLIAVVWAARFWNSSSFGLYEDDYTRIPGVFNMTVAELGQQISFAIRNLADNAKPLHSTLIFSLAFFGNWMGGLGGIYVIGFAVVACNAVLFYFLSRRLFDELFAVCAAFAYVLFSADTTQAFITHSLGLQPSLTFLLLAFHAHLSRKRTTAHALAALILLTYEVPYPVFMAAPLLSGTWDRRKAREVARHGLMMVGIFALIVLMRVVIGESRVTSLAFPAIVTIPLTHMLQGPVVAMGTYFYRPFQALAEFRSDSVLALAASLPIFASVLYFAREGSRPKAKALLDLLRANTRLPVEVSKLLRIAAASSFMLILAYALTFTVRAHAISGRDTRVHLAAAPAAALLLAAAVRFGFGSAQTTGRKLAVSVTFAALLSGVLGFGFQIQADYADAWRLQKAFWSDLVPDVADIQNGQVILVEPAGLVDTRHIDANTWNMPRVLKLIAAYPADWDEPPRAFRLTANWADHIVAENGLVSLDASTVVAPPDLYRTVAAEDVIFMQTIDGVPHRLLEPLVVNDEPIQIDIRPGLPAFPIQQGPLFYLMVQE
jgi:hypothetical protein